jgi:flagellar hook-associated protein 1 FlgK
MSDFAALNTALSGLLAHRRVLEVIGHNVANATTEGYSRRRAELSPVSAAPVGGVFSRSDRHGGGVEVSDVVRVRDEFMEARAQEEHGLLGRTAVEATVLARIEDVLPEPSDVGLAAQLAEFWAGWDDLANTPGDLSTRTALLERAETLALSLHRAADELVALRDGQLDEAMSLVEQVNATSVRIAELNDEIRAATAAGIDAHDLADERDRLVLDLGSLTGAVARPGEMGAVDVFLDGSTLVRGNRAELLTVAEAGPLPGPLAATGLQEVQVRWAIDGSALRVQQGRLGGVVNGTNSLVPEVLADLDGVAATLVANVNALHQGGQGLDTVLDVSLDFFDPTGTRASTIALSSDVAGQPSRIAAATLGAGALDASVAQQLAALATAATGADVAYQNMIGNLAVEAQAADRRDRVQDLVVRQVDDARISVSGVNLDEELTAMVQEQRAYEAAARLLTTVDEMLDVLINRTGLVGR